MPDFARTEVTLQVSGDELDPAWVTSKLGIEPTQAHRKGEAVGKRNPARTGVWSLSDTNETRSLEEKLRHLMSLISMDQQGWLVVTRKWRVRAFCGIFLDEWNEGTVISPDILAELAKRRIQLELDVYYAGEPDE